MYVFVLYDSSHFRCKWALFAKLAFKACVACSFQLCAFELHLFGNALVQCVLLNWLVKLIQVDNLHNFGSIDMLDKLEF